MQEIWRRIDAWLAANAPEMGRTLRPGATGAEITAAERSIGVTFPDDYRESLSVHDGQSPSATGLVLSWRLRPAKEVASTWSMMQRLVAEEVIPEGDDADLRCAGPVRPQHWNARWVPVATDGGGNERSLDLDPAAGGAVGQVISVWTDAAQREVVAPGFRDWLLDLADGLEAGRYAASYSSDGWFRGITASPAPTRGPRAP